MQSRDHLQALLATLIDEHLVWVCKNHVSYDKKMEIVGLVSITIDSNPNAIPVKFNHMIRRESSPSRTRAVDNCVEDGWKKRESQQRSELSSTEKNWPLDGYCEQSSEACDGILIAASRNGQRMDATERDAIMTMLDRRALGPLDGTEQSASNNSTGAAYSKPVGAQKRKCKHSECFKMTKTQRTETKALDLTKRRESHSPVNDEEYRTSWRAGANQQSVKDNAFEYANGVGNTHVGPSRAGVAACRNGHAECESGCDIVERDERLMESNDREQSVCSEADTHEQASPKASDYRALRSASSAANCNGDFDEDAQPSEDCASDCASTHEHDALALGRVLIDRAAPIDMCGPLQYSSRSSMQRVALTNAENLSPRYADGKRTSVCASRATWQAFGGNGEQHCSRTMGDFTRRPAEQAAGGQRNDLTNDSPLHTMRVASVSVRSTHPGCSDGRGTSHADRRWQQTEMIGGAIVSAQRAGNDQRIMNREDNQQIVLSSSANRGSSRQRDADMSMRANWQKPELGHEYASLMKADKHDAAERLDRSPLNSHTASSTGDKNGRTTAHASGNYDENDRCDRLNEEPEHDNGDSRSQSGSDTPIGNQRDGVSRSNAEISQMTLATQMNANANANANVNANANALAAQHSHVPPSSISGLAVGGAPFEKAAIDSSVPLKFADSSPIVSASTPECHMCRAQFESLPALATHYDDEHKYIICQYCGKSFSTRQNLRRHERLHTGQRPYVCTVCQQGFYRRDAMMSHMGRAHTDRPGAGYQCTICHSPSTTYNDKFTFRNHMQKKHGVLDVVFCNECVLAFGDKQAYRDHKAQVHNELSLTQQAASHSTNAFHRGSTGVANGRESATSDTALQATADRLTCEKLSDLHAQAKYAAMHVDANRGLLMAHHPELSRTGLEADAVARNAQAPAGMLLNAAAALQNTQTLVKHLSEIAARGGANMPFMPPDVQRSMPPFYPPFPFAHIPPIFPRGVPSPHGTQCPLPAPQMLPNALSPTALNELPSFANLLHPLVVEQLRMNPGVLEKLIAEMKDKTGSAARDQDSEETQVRATDESVTGENNNEKQSVKDSPVESD